MKQRWAGPLATTICIAAGVLVLIAVVRIAGANPLNVAQAVARGAAGGSCQERWWWAGAQRRT